MFSALIEEPDDFTPIEKAKPADILSAQAATVDWLNEMGVPSDEALDKDRQVVAAREAFTAVNFETDDHKKRAALVAIKTPAAVQHLTGMLVAYDWEFVNQAKELRGYTVANIVEETKHPDARIRLKALQMLGNVTEVGLFTERVEITRRDISETEIESRLRERLEKFMGAVVDVTDVKPLPAPAGAPADAEDSIDAEIGRVAEVAPTVPAASNA
jgi:hypothetical protein